MTSTILPNVHQLILPYSNTESLMVTVDCVGSVGLIGVGLSVEVLWGKENGSFSSSNGSELVILQPRRS